MKIESFTTSIVESVEFREALWQTYVSAFTGAAVTCAQRQQCHDRSSFLAALLDPDFVKFVVLADGTPVGLVMATNDLDKASVANCSPEFFRRRYPAAASAGRVYYCTALAVRPSHQDTGTFHALTLRVTEFIGDSIVFAGDYTDNSTPWLGDALVKEARSCQKELAMPTDDVDFKIVDKQYYFALQLRKTP